MIYSICEERREVIHSSPPSGIRERDAYHKHNLPEWSKAQINGGIEALLLRDEHCWMGGGARLQALFQCSPLASY